MELKNKRIVILVADHFQDMEVMYPYYRFREAGAEVAVAGVGKREFRGKFGYPIHAGLTFEECWEKDFDAVIVPGGWAPDSIRMNRAALDFLRAMDKARKIVAPICHGAWVPVSAGIVKGRTLAAYAAVRDDVENAGGRFVDQECAVDDNFISARRPDDLPAFCRAIVAALSR
jgi:protease I